MARISAVGLIALLLTLTSHVTAQCLAATGRFTPKMASGYRAKAIMTGLKSPRGIVIDTEGNLLVAETGGNGIRRLVLTESGSDVCVKSSSMLITGAVSNHGIDLSKDGKTLFVSNLQQVAMYPYDAVAGTVGAAKVIVTGLGNSGPHPTRTILVSKTNPDVLLVARGSNANVDTATTAQSAGRCMIKQFSISAVSTTPAVYTSGGEVLGWGLRNIVGMGENVDGGIWSVENSMDDVKLGGKDVHNENPAERMNYHGIAGATTNAMKGLNFGYPSCVAAWGTDLLGGSYKPGQLFSPDGVPKTINCATSQPPRVIFPSHTAPLDVKFTPEGDTAYISFHGSWDRNPPDGYRVMKVSFANGQPVAAADSKSAAVPIMENTNTGACPGSCFRPVGLSFDAKKRLYMSSDTSGEIYVIYGA